LPIAEELNIAELLKKEQQFTAVKAAYEPFLLSLSDVLLCLLDSLMN
jgi:hypothetical protein